MKLSSFLLKYRSLLIFFLLFFGWNIARAEEIDSFPSATSTDSVIATSTTADDQITVTGNGLEPTIRVGIYKTDQKVMFVSPFPYTVESNDVDLGVIPENEVVTITYATGTYAIASDSLSTSSTDFIRFVPEDDTDYFSIMNLDRHLVTRSQLNFNAFRGIMEYRYSPLSGQPFVINELLLDNYVAGVGETSNGAPEEYIKALQIAARSYAYEHVGPVTSKHLYDVHASTVDQLYLGYNFESFSPRIAFFTAGTRGLMVTYNDQPITAYYFSRSSGYTKTKKGVPWLKAVKAKYDKGKSRLGHGYGMSNHDAVLRAMKDGWQYDKILKYYYTGTAVQKFY